MGCRSCRVLGRVMRRLVDRMEFVCGGDQPPINFVFRFGRKDLKSLLYACDS